MQLTFVGILVNTAETNILDKAGDKTASPILVWVFLFLCAVCFYLHCLLNTFETNSTDYCSLFILKIIIYNICDVSRMQRFWLSVYALS